MAKYCRRLSSDLLMWQVSTKVEPWSLDLLQALSEQRIRAVTGMRSTVTLPRLIRHFADAPDAPRQAAIATQNSRIFSSPLSLAHAACSVVALLCDDVSEYAHNVSVVKFAARMLRSALRLPVLQGAYRTIDPKSPQKVWDGASSGHGGLLHAAGEDAPFVPAPLSIGISDASTIGSPAHQSEVKGPHHSSGAIGTDSLASLAVICAQGSRVLF